MQHVLSVYLLSVLSICLPVYLFLCVWIKLTKTVLKHYLSRNHVLRRESTDFGLKRSRVKGTGSEYKYPFTLPLLIHEATLPFQSTWICICTFILLYRCCSVCLGDSTDCWWRFGKYRQSACLSRCCVYVVVPSRSAAPWNFRVMCLCGIIHIRTVMGTS